MTTKRVISASEKMEIIGMKAPWVPEEEMEMTGGRLREIALTGKPLHYDGNRRRKDGKMLGFHISMAPITDLDGKVNTISTIGIPIEPKANDNN